MGKSILFVFCFLAAMTISGQQIEPKVHRVGKYKVYSLTESEGKGNKSILINAPEKVLEQCAPDGTFPNAIHAFLIEKQGEIWLIDTGFGRNIFNQMASVNITPEKVNHVLLTHMHGDHIGGMLRDEKPTFPNADVTVSRMEHGYWSSNEEMMKMPENRRGNFISAQNVFKEYGEKIRIQEPANTSGNFTDGIHMLEAYGHTPGHVMFLVKDGLDELLVWGDITHAMAIQMPHPEISVTYDVDPDRARESRIKVLKYVTDKNIPVAGMHIPFSGIGIIKKDKDLHGYIFDNE